MMDPRQMMAAALKCQTRPEALELVRRETASLLHSIDNLTEADARTNVLGRIAYSAGAGMSPEESARVMALFQVAHPPFGGDTTQWPAPSHSTPTKEAN